MALLFGRVNDGRERGWTRLPRKNNNKIVTGRRSGVSCSLKVTRHTVLFIEINVLPVAPKFSFFVCLFASWLVCVRLCVFML